MPLYFPQAQTLKRRVKRLAIDADMFLKVLKGMDGLRRIRCEGLPDDARVIGIVTDKMFNTVELYIESSTFNEIPVEYVAENLDLKFTEYHGNAVPI